MTKEEFRKKREQLVAESANLEGAAFDAKQRELTALINEFNGETAELKREEKQAEKMSLCMAIREAAKNDDKSFVIREGKTATVANFGANVVATEIQSILEPLYAKSVLPLLGVRSYTGVPMGDLSIPVMGKGNVGWEGEIDEAKESKNSFSNVTLKPHRLTAFVDISKQLILQENVGANEAIHRDIVNALRDTFEATIFGDGDGSTGAELTLKTGVAPVGIFNGKELTDASTFSKLVQIEASIEDANITGECKYLMNSKTKADLRVMPTNGSGSRRVMEGGTVDGTTAIVTSNVKTAGSFVYGDWSQFAVALWDGVEITVDPYTQATKGCIRLVINAYMDAKVIRSEAFAFGKTRA